MLGDEALPVVEAEPHEEDFYDFEARYTIGRTTFHCPAELDAARPTRPGSRAAAARALGLEGFSRVDLLLDARAASSTCSRPTRSRG